MIKKQLALIFVCRTIGSSIWGGLLPLLPIYASQLGANPSWVGNYFSLAFAAVLGGSVVAGWASDRFQHRRELFVAAGVISAVAIWLMGQVTSFWQLVLLTVGVWFMAGAAVTLLLVLTELLTEQAERGRAFSLLAMSMGLGRLLGGSMAGPIADRWGYTTMLLVLALFTLLWPAMGLWLKDKVEVANRSPSRHQGTRCRYLGRVLLLLLLANTLAWMARSTARLGTSLAMAELGFLSAAVSSTEALGGAVSLTLLPLIGWLSDRVGRRRLLASCFLVSAVGLAVLAVSVAYWHFLLASALVAFVLFSSNALGPAMVADVTPSGSLGKGMSLFMVTPSIGGIVAFAATGYAIEYLGTPVIFATGAGLLVVAIVLLNPLSSAD